MTKPTKQWHCQRCTCIGVIIPRDSARSRLCRWCADELRAAGLVWCSPGQHARPAEAFSAAGLRAYTCRECQTEQNRAWREAHREEALVAQAL
jgi:hypothetical protein